MEAAEHMQEATRHLNSAAACAANLNRPGDVTYHLGAAQVHATLALAAATVDATDVAAVLAEAARR